MKAVAAFVHGEDGFGNTNQKIVQVSSLLHLGVVHGSKRPSRVTTLLQGRKIDKTAAKFIAESINSDPGNVTVLALGPLTNIAMAFQVNPDVAKNIVSSS